MLGPRPLVSRTNCHRVSRRLKIHPISIVRSRTHSPILRGLLLIVFCAATATTVIAQRPPQPVPSPTPRRALSKPVVARGFEQFAKRDASARLIAGGATRIIVDPGDHFTRGEAFYKGRQYEPARKELEKAIEASPDWDDPHYVLALTLTELFKLKEAIEEYKQVVRLAIKDEPKILAYYNMGNAYFDLGDYENAIESYKQAIKLDPTLSKPHNNLGLAYAAIGKFSEAVAEFAEAVRHKPDYAEAHFNLGVAYVQLGRTKQADTQQKILLKLSPQLAAKLEALINKQG